MELLLILGAVLLWKYSSDANKFLDNVQLAFSDISLDFPKTLASGFTRLYLTIKVSIKNDTDFEIKLLKLHNDVYYKDQLIGSSDATGSFQILKHATASQKIPITVDTSKVVGVVKDIITNYTVPVSFLFKGYADITLGRINYTSKQTLVI